MKKTVMILLALILVVAFTGVCKASNITNLLFFYIPSTLNQAYGFPVKIWDGKVMTLRPPEGLKIVPNPSILGSK